MFLSIALEDEDVRLKGENMKVVETIKEKDDVIANLKKPNSMLDEIIKEKNEMIAKMVTTLQANKQELNNAKFILKKYESQSNEISIVERFKHGHGEFGKQPISYEFY